MMNAARAIVLRFGGGDFAAGAREVSKICGVNVSQVYRWTHPREQGGTGGFVPHWHHGSLLEAARARDLPLEPAEFVAPPASGGQVA